MKGVSESKLLDLAHREDQRNVPIGAPFLVNDVDKVSKDVKELLGSERLVTPNLKQFSAEGYDSLGVGRDVDEDRVEFNAPPQVGSLRLVEGTYRGDTGELIFTRANKEQIVLRDLLRLDQLGEGAEGPRGMPGPDGDDGYDGYDGCDGENGCEGAKGIIGLTGPAGPEGEDGPEGEPGPQGCEGPIGIRGIQGEEGRHGYEGPRGPAGPDCNDKLQGAAGPAGPMFGEGVWFGQIAAAPMSVAIVGLPDDGIDSPVGAPDAGIPPTPKPPPPKPDPLPQDPPKPPEPEPPPVPVDGKCVPCTKINRNPRDFCDGNWSTWGTTYVHNMGKHKVGKAFGISNLPCANNTANWPHNMVFCGTFTRGAEFSYEFTAPAGILVQLKFGCAQQVTFDGTGGTHRGTFIGNPDRSITVRMVGKSKKIPMWFAWTVKNDKGEIVYYTGMNQKYGSDPTSRPKEWIIEQNWFSNTVMQQIGDC